MPTIEDVQLTTDLLPGGRATARLVEESGTINVEVFDEYHHAFALAGETITVQRFKLPTGDVCRPLGSGLMQMATLLDALAIGGTARATIGGAAVTVHRPATVGSVIPAGERILVHYFSSERRWVAGV